MDLTAPRALLTELAHASGEFIRPFCAGQVAVEHKADATPVTEADGIRS